MHKSFILALTVPWNVLNWLSCGQRADAISPQGMPIGFQIVGKPYEDLKVFQIAHAYEAAAPRLFSGGMMPDFRG